MDDRHGRDERLACERLAHEALERRHLADDAGVDTPTMWIAAGFAGVGALVRRAPETAGNCLHEAALLRH
ncbi:hypothetical protein GCM10022237_43830 [Nocardioides ginsengisoli]